LSLVTGLALAAIGAACSSSDATPGGNGAPDGSVGDDGSTPPSGDDGGVKPGTDSGGHDAAGDTGANDGAAPSCITPTSPQSCAAPQGTALPICKLSQTGCMDAKDVTKLAKSAVYYEVNSPLWSDNAAKTRAFVLPQGGKIHVKDCSGDAGASAECTSPSGVPNGPAETGKWVFPVGTVMIKNFLFDGKLVETRLLMRVDAATAAIVANGTDWVGYNYAWNEAQTEATVVPNARTPVSFNTGKRTVTWDYPSFIDCVACHAAAVGTLGPETAQMNRDVDGGNQIDTLVAAGFFDTTAPQKPYAAAIVEPYANAALGLAGPPASATAEDRARSYLSANCGFCHRPDVNDQGFDLRHALSFAETNLCNLTSQKGVPGFPPNQTFVEVLPGDHTKSALWLRMHIAVPASDPNETQDVGRMPPVASLVIDPQASDVVGQWIDGITSCPDAGP
jgi:cytochrome c551/c552